MRPASLSLIALAAVASPLGARAQTYDLGEIVVSANLEDTAANKVGSTVDVLTAADLQQSASTSIADYFTNVAGVAVRPAGGFGGASSVSIRGASQQYVAVQIDGIDVTDPSLTQVYFDFGQLATDGISRVEVLKGSQSALYGSSAVGGLIDISSLKATEPGFHQYFDAQYGSRNTAILSYGVTEKTDRGDLAVSFSHTGTDGYVATTSATASSQPAGYWGNRVSANGSYRFDNGVKLGFAIFGTAGHGDYDPQFYNDPTQYGQATQVSVGARLYAEFDTGALKNTVSISAYNITRNYVDGAFGSQFSDNTYTGTRVKLAYQGAVSLNAQTRLVFGAEATREIYDQKGTYGTLNAATNSAAVFSELSYSPTDRLDLTFALRRDEISGFGGATTGRVAAAYRVGDGVTLRASVGTGFRAPSNYELYGLGPTVLQPESSTGADIGIEKRFENGAMIKATAFWLNVDNLIQYNALATSCGSGFGCYSQVPGQTRTSGLELEGELPLGSRASLIGAYTYTKAEASSTNYSYSPEHMLSLSLKGQLTDKLSAVLTGEYGGGLRDNAGAYNRPDYTVFSTTFTYAIDDRTQAFLRVENLFNEKYQLVSGYNQPGRSVYVGLRKSF